MLEDAAGDETVGVTGERALEGRVEPVAEEHVVAVDEREVAARDVFRDGVPRVALLVAPLEHLRGDIGLVAQIEFGRETEIGAEAVEGVLRARVVVEDVVVGAAHGGLDARVDHAVGGRDEGANLGQRVGDRGVDDGVVDDGVAVIALVPVVEKRAEPRERKFLRGAPAERERDGVVTLVVALLIAVGLVVRVVQAVVES